jgi:hypothetical protein
MLIIKWTILNENTTFCNQTTRVLFIIYTALHVSAYMQAIIKCYLTILQWSSYWILFRGSTESRYYITVAVYYIANMQYEYTVVKV